MIRYGWSIGESDGQWPADWTLTMCVVSCRSHDVRAALLHGSNGLPPQQVRHPADRLELRAAVYAHHDPHVPPGVQPHRGGRLRQVRPHHGLPTALAQ